MIVLELPWPDRALHPNARVHWAVKAKAAKTAREDAFWRTKGLGPQTLPDGRFAIAFIFQPPDNRKRDDDGLIASMKNARDGVAQALGIDDNRFITYPPKVADVFPGGKVVVFIAPEKP